MFEKMRLELPQKCFKCYMLSQSSVSMVHVQNIYFEKCFGMKFTVLKIVFQNAIIQYE